MRIIIKGGVWKNTEDEVLKAAVMKYGKNQWARVASLLARKSAKQCKARWYEWLDPSIKKTEWSREEEEKLLHLAKLMPSQWRTIAPIVGRTAGQCMEHYEKLLDAAQSQDVTIDEEDDPRRLRPGEIDPNPETKPARPDPIDMDEDEKEMLSEARARLVNTQGKKAKRKAREKQLEESRRLAVLQKRRELKAAGIHSGGGARRAPNRRFMDYAREIPFEKTAPIGFHDVGQEKLNTEVATDPRKTLSSLDKLEGKRRTEEEKKARKADAQRQKRLAKTQLPMQLERINELNDPSRALKRRKLELPTPVISNAELADIAKIGSENASLLAREDATASDATRALIADYVTSTPSSSSSIVTPMRTPAPPAADIVMQEAANLVARAREETPLLGGENITLAAGTGYEGMTPRTTTIATPNNATINNTPHKTPLRDEFHINQEVGGALQVKNNSLQERLQREKLQKSFASLPAAQNDYEIALPEQLPNTTTEEISVLTEDAADRDARLAAEARAEAEAEFRRRSSVMQKGLPRPAKVRGNCVKNSNTLIQEEMQRMLHHDDITFPLKKKKRNNSKVSSLEEFTDELLQRARNTIDVEVNLTLKQLSSSYIDYNKHGAEWQECFDSSEKNYGDGNHQILQENLKKAQRRSEKLEARYNLLNGGYQKRIKDTEDRMVELKNKTLNAHIETSCFQMLHQIEKRALPIRMASIASAVNKELERESVLQKRYAALLEEKSSNHLVQL